jgi:hypothetical protein
VLVSPLRFTSMETTTELPKLLASLKLRTDQQQEADYNLSTFVPVLDFGTLAAPNAQIIYGRNGTGKTHLLKAFCEYVYRNYETQNVLPVYIDCKLLELGTVGPEIEVSQLILRYYRLFVAKIVDALQELASKVLTPTRLEKFLGRGDANRVDRIEGSIAKLKKIFRYEDIEENVKEYKRKIALTSEDASKSSAGVSIKLSAMEDPKIGADVGISAEDARRRVQAVEFIYEGLAVIDYEAVRKELENIIQLCGAKGIVLLVDEWSAIDLGVQPLFAEIIKKTLAQSDRIHLKIVALKYFTRTSAVVNAPQRIGFQPGIDISPVADLDSLLCFDTDGQAVKDFLTVIAYKHCAAISEQVAKTNLKDFELAMCRELFEGPEAYLEIVRASEGNPRDFLSLLASCCAVRLTHNKAVGQRDAVKAAINYFISAKEPTIKSNPKAVVFYKKLFEEVVKNKQKLFLLTTEKAEANASILELLAFRCIHMVNPKYTALEEGGLPHEYTLFSMDYGKLASLKVQRAGENLVRAMSQAASILGTIMGTPSFLTGYISKTFETLDVGSGLINVAGAQIVSKEGVEAGNIDPEILVSKCVYDSLL